VGITPKITPPAHCKGGSSRVKTRPAPPCNELCFQAPSSYLSGSHLEFRHILIHDVEMSKRELRLIGHAYIHTLELYDG